MQNFLDLINKRRTVYPINGKSKLSQDEIVKYLQEVTRGIPSASNSQTTRLVVVFNDKNKKLWEHILQTQEKVLDAGTFGFMKPVMELAANAVGTVLFFEDRNVVKATLGESPRAEVYKQHNNAYLQFGVWLALNELDFGASLQHFNIGFEQGYDKGIKALLNLPEQYELVAEMPFGSHDGNPEPKEKIADDLKVQVIK